MDAATVSAIVGVGLTFTVTVGGAGWKMARSIDRLVDRIDQMSGDLYGEPEKPWQPGALERLERLEKKAWPAYPGRPAAGRTS